MTRCKRALMLELLKASGFTWLPQFIIQNIIRESEKKSNRSKSMLLGDFGFPYGSGILQKVFFNLFA